MGPEEEFPEAGELSRLMLGSILKYSGVGVAMLDRNLVYTWCNDMLTYEGRLPRERRIGRRPSEVLPAELAAKVEDKLREVLATGDSVLNFEIIGPSPVGRRLLSWWFSAFRIDDDQGAAVGTWYMIADQSRERRARTRLQLLNRASERIGSTLDIPRTAQELADVAVPDFADLVSVELLEPVLRGEEPPLVQADVPVVLVRSGLRAAFGSPEVPGPGAVLPLPAGTAIRQSLISGDPLVVSVAESRAGWPAGDPGWVAPLQHLGVTWMCAVPVQARGTTLGIAFFCRRAGGEPHDAEDVSLAVELAARAGVCLDNARRFQRERQATLALQRSLLPRGLHSTPALEVASRYLPASGPTGLGGDWVDVIPLSGARVALVAGDVVGHGATAVAAMGQLSTAVRTLAGLDLSPAELLAHLDDRVLKLAEQDGPAAPGAAADEQPLADHVLGATCLYVVYDPVTRRCAAARAGHLAPAVLTASGDVTFAALPAGLPLGVGLLPFESAEFPLEDGALLTLFTDGLVESRGHDIDEGLARLAGDLARPAGSAEEVCDHIIGPVLDTPAEDDSALVVARVHGLDADHVAAWDLPSDPVHVRDAREMAGRKLADWGWGDLALTCELVVSELVTNAIRYGRPPIRLLLIRQEPDMLICEVSDGSSTSPHLRIAGATDEDGRGLFLISQVARRWGTRYTESGKTIWVEQQMGAVAADGTAA
ncbi:MAG TPA: SpoIIE family protein phosphatase [Streptosporangiaceae bacterium]|nr:SpoIIE family protein phosphatase [Streptosporangiaceae bacterium]